MKKPSSHQRELDVTVALLHRRGRKTKKRKKSSNSISKNALEINAWINKKIKEGLDISIILNKVCIILPERLNFNQDLELTAMYFNAIRMLTQKRITRNSTFRLGTVNFDNLRSISTSASLVLTAELSKWDDTIRNRLKPSIKNWDQDILTNFLELGFFDLFNIKPTEIEKLKSKTAPNKQIVKYIKGRCGDDQKTKILKSAITTMIGDEINKWMFLHSGLSEAIVNVSHHAYPVKNGYSEIDKHWYLTASYDEIKKELKVVFYDQGIGIPKSLPASELWEKSLDYLSFIPLADRMKDETLLKAAVELDRTSTHESDRGKGLQDLLEFIRQRGDGSLSILSLKGMFELEIKDGVERTRSERFDNPVSGTLIIWSVMV